LAPVYANGSGTNYGTTMTPLVAATWYKLQITRATFGGSIDFSVDGTSVLTLASGIPTTGLNMVLLQQNATTVTRSFSVDYASVQFPGAGLVR
jgi:hypothetical protein